MNVYVSKCMCVRKSWELRLGYTQRSQSLVLLPCVYQKLQLRGRVCYNVRMLGKQVQVKDSPRHLDYKSLWPLH